MASLHVIGKATVIKIAKNGKFNLSKVGDVSCDMTAMHAQATKFICVAYGKVTETCTSMMDCRVEQCRLKSKKCGETSVKLCSLPPPRHLQKMSRDATSKLLPGNLHSQNHHHGLCMGE